MCAYSTRPAAWGHLALAPLPRCAVRHQTFTYCYSCDPELLQEWDLETRYVNQPQILRYLEHVTDRWKLRDDIQLNTGITAAHFESSSRSR